MGSPTQAVVGVQGGAAGGSSSQRPVHTSPGGRGFLPKRLSVLKEGLRGAAGLGGLRSPAQAVVGVQGGAAGGSSSQRPVHTSPGGRGFLPRRLSVLKEGLRGAAGLGRRGVLPRRRSVLMEGLRGVSVPKRPGHTSLGGAGIPS